MSKAKPKTPKAPVKAAEAPVTAEAPKTGIDADKLKNAAVAAYKASGRMSDAHDAVLTLIADAPAETSVTFDSGRRAGKITYTRCADGSWTEKRWSDLGTTYLFDSVPAITAAERIAGIAIKTYWN